MARRNEDVWRVSEPMAEALACAAILLIVAAFVAGDMHGARREGVESVYERLENASTPALEGATSTLLRSKEGGFFFVGNASAGEMSMMYQDERTLNYSVQWRARMHTMSEDSCHAVAGNSSGCEEGSQALLVSVWCQTRAGQDLQCEGKYAGVLFPVARE